MLQSHGYPDTKIGWFCTTEVLGHDAIHPISMNYLKVSISIMF